MFFKGYRNYIKDRINKARAARGDKKYLLNLFADWQLLQEMIEKVNTNPDLVVELITNDGTRVVIKQKAENYRRTVNWEM